MDILHIAPINMTVANGYRFAVPGLANAQSNLEDVNVTLINVRNKKKLKKDELDTYKFNFINYEDIQNLDKEVSNIGNLDIVVFHGIYCSMNYIKLYKYFKKEGIPYIIVPHCSLTKGAQSQKKLKKSIFNRIFFDKFIKNSEKIHYLTENEMVESEAFKQDYFILGNGMELNKSKIKDINKMDRMNLTYIGRIDIKHKGLDILINSLEKIKIELKKYNVSVNLYGTDFEDGKRKLKKMIYDKGLNDIVFVNEAVFGNDKETVLLNTDIFITTSRFEGHPMSVLEAMSYGLPCILTPGTNMTEELKLYNAGWCVGYDENEISSTIINAVKCKFDINEKGKNAKKIVENKYTWDNIAKKSIIEYKKIINER